MKHVGKSFLSAAIVCALGLAVDSAQAATQVRADFNGDGFEDLAIGAPGEGIGGDAGAGAVNVIYGTAAGLGKLANSTQIFFQDQPGIAREFSEPGDNFGAALAVGDFNGDGFSDLAIGAFSEDLTSGGVNVRNAGVVHILYGTSIGLTDLADQIWDQDSPGIFGVPGTNAFFGVSLAAADFDNDGFDDVAVGASGHSILGFSNVGAVITLKGSASGLTATGSQGLHEAAIFGLPQFAESGDNFGATLAAGDFGGDGFADLAIGVPGEDFSSGNANDPTDRGAVVVVYGAPVGLRFDLRDNFDQDDVGMLDDAEAFDRFGSALAAGDFNGDGRDDLAIGIPQEDLVGSSGALINTGAVAVLYGSNIGAGLRVTGNQFWHQDVSGIEDISETSDFFGRALVAGDFNGDNRDDLAIGVPFEDLGGVAGGGIQNAGAVEVIYGTAAGLSAANDQRWNQEVQDFITNTFIIDDGETGDQFGLSLAAGDFNDDGRDDLAVGVPAEDAGVLADAGGVNVIYAAGSSGLGVPNNQFWDQLALPDGIEAGDRFGAALAGQGPGSASGAGFSGEWGPLTQHCGRECRIQGRLAVLNPGTTTADPSLVRFFLSDDKTLDESDVLIEEVSLNALAPGKSVQIKLRAAVPGGQNAQGLFVIAVLDAEDVVPEINEANNVIASRAVE